MQLPAFITDRLRDRVWKTMKSRAPDIRIGPEADPYMERWHALRRNKFFNIYLHLYHHDDDRILHSHPWWSFSICLSGMLREYFTASADGANRPEQHKTRVIGKGDVALRSADMFHRLEVHGTRTITIFFTGPKLKTWYFACKRGLIEWTQFVSDRDRGVPGAGCGETDEYPAPKECICHENNPSCGCSPKTIH